MLKEERLEFIINQLRSNQSVKLGALSEALRVSEDTIRRDIEGLAKNGLLTKVRGGAIPHSPNAHSFGERIHASEKEKEIIARKALSLIRPGQTLLLDGGTTTYALAGLLDMPLTIITNNIPAAALLAGRKNMEVIIAGGRILPDSRVTAGAHAISLFEESHVDICFIGVCSLHHEIGVSSIDYFECEMKRAMVRCSDQVVALTGHAKIGTAETYKICPIDTLDYIVTEIDPGDELFGPYRDRDIRIC
ncbi:MAG: DeoR/GlpR family DNA-binding transcription regulator [Bacteroidota bacterium]|nr:DeoR/GlpR family DNA-binding transcription regulator [Bacteroidota bacterium]MDP4216713.1 DeoR/GlpR family DNA-binding transcription regulator [Bacteroidota bacterium]MDP4245961.1 DeoR/GlpR family DNA-binding transcription regulator [Bacteroidota bacterium]MDP4253588.1 DeoR/GlpR family DNA-binding transcription regulator [Bacteroidota bacterium]MDP4257257.1 DeoR/GlpR family DNA-binding transcription regulator [Bacteroidota bacterium]